MGRQGYAADLGRRVVAARWFSLEGGGGGEGGVQVFCLSVGKGK